MPYKTDIHDNIQHHLGNSGSKTHGYLEIVGYHSNQAYINTAIYLYLLYSLN